MFTLHKSQDGWRHEKKYALTQKVYEVLKRRCDAVMQRDKHTIDGGYRVTSLYFDDVYRTSYNDKLNGYLRRCKYRVRVYNLSPERINLEAKIKEGEYIRKKSAVLNIEEYNAIIKSDYTVFGKRTDSEFLRNFCVHAQIKNLKPAFITDYFREAFVAETGNVRVTFDSRLSAGFGSVDMFKATYSPSFDGVVLEVKYDRFIPSYIEELITGFPMMSEPVSKFILSANKTSEVNKKWAL